ncbi:MAG TPA: hypothetical protein VGG29_16145 [Caulobacteraceae bacterium]|jgi:hypothetical protein
MMKARHYRGLGVAAALACAALAAPAVAGAPWPTPGAAGAQGYRYEVLEHHAGGADGGTRMDFRLASDGKGGLVADIARVWALHGGDWTPVTLDADCLARLHARPGEVAELTLLPMTPESAHLGEAFMSTCAPDEVFTPVTDILNISLIVTSGRFHAETLTRVGQTETIEGFSTRFDRGAMTMAEASDGGEVTLASLDDGEAGVEWKPSPSTLQLTRGTGAAQVNLDGGEHFAFHVTIDRRTGLLVGAKSIYDDVDFNASGPGMPAGPPVKLAIQREVSIVRTAE